MSQGVFGLQVVSRMSCLLRRGVVAVWLVGRVTSWVRAGDVVSGKARLGSTSVPGIDVFGMQPVRVGIFAVVWRGRQASGGDTVALKSAREESRSRRDCEYFSLRGRHLRNSGTSRSQRGAESSLWATIQYGGYALGKC